MTAFFFPPRAAQETPAPMAGIDEAGRGCLAGPVVAAAVILPPVYALPGLTDSKALTAPRRDELATGIRACAMAWGLGVIWPPIIDEINILQATFRAMARAAAALKIRPHRLLIDGNKTIPTPVLTQMLRNAPPPEQRAIVDGDALEPAISAASILAKTFRDKLMSKLDARYPAYGLARHKGYGTREHLAALREHDPCPLHRLTFRGVLPEKPAPQQGNLC